MSVRSMHSKRAATRSRERSRLLLANVDEGDVRALAGECLDDTRADARPAAGDQHALAAQARIDSAHFLADPTKRLPPDVNRLRLRVEFDRGEALLARAVARLARAAERNMIIDACGRQVDHHHSRPDLPAEMPRMLQ